MPALEQEEVTLLPRNPPVADGLEKIVSCFGELHTPGVGGLAQAWMPTHMRRQAENLETKGMPYAILGPGDMLPCFRALCCKYSFTTDLRELHLMGAPGRVYMSGQAETSDNVQQFSQRIYPVLSEAKACSVSATVVLPIFANAQRAKAVAVLELFQFNGPGFGYKTVFDWANRHLRAAGLYTAGMETQAFEMQSHALSFDFFCKQSSVLSSLDFMFSSKANSTGNSSVAPAKKCQKMHHTGSDAQGLEASQRQLGSISSKPAPMEQNPESSPDLNTGELGRAFLSQHYSGVSPEAVHGTTQQPQPQARDDVASQPAVPATAAEEPPPPDVPAYSAPEAAAVSAEQQPMQSFSRDATAEEMEEQQRFESQELLPADWGDPATYRFVSQEMVPSPGPCSGESAEPFGYLGMHWGNLGAEASHALDNLQSKQVVPVSGIFNDLYPMAPLKRKVDRMSTVPKELVTMGRRHSSTTRLESDADDPEEPAVSRRDVACSLQPGEVHNKKTLTREVLEAHFGGTLAEAAVALGVCSTTLKRACRRHGIAAWPRKTRYLSRQTQEATRPQPPPATAADAGRNGYAAGRMNFSAATRSHDAAFEALGAAGAMLSNGYGSENCNSEQQASMTVAPGDRSFPQPDKGMHLPINGSQQLEPSYAEHAPFIPDHSARALFPEAHIMTEPSGLSEGSGPLSAGTGLGHPQDKSLKESVAELETLFLGSGLDTNWHPPASAAGSGARLEGRPGGACNSAASPATDAFPEIPEAWLETAFLCN